MVDADRSIADPRRATQTQYRPRHWQLARSPWASPPEALTDPHRKTGRSVFVRQVNQNERQPLSRDLENSRASAFQSLSFLTLSVRLMTLRPSIHHSRRLIRSRDWRCEDNPALDATFHRYARPR